MAAATARQLLLVKARDKLKVDFETLRVEDGVISSVETNRVTDYWQLHGGKPFEHRMEQMPPLKPRDHYHLVGGETTRIDLQAKLSGRPAFISGPDPTRPGARPGRSTSGAGQRVKESRRRRPRIARSHQGNTQRQFCRGHSAKRRTGDWGNNPAGRLLSLERSRFAS